MFPTWRRIKPQQLYLYLILFICKQTPPPLLQNTSVAKLHILWHWEYITKMHLEFQITPYIVLCEIGYLGDHIFGTLENRGRVNGRPRYSLKWSTFLGDVTLKPQVEKGPSWRRTLFIRERTLRWTRFKWTKVQCHYLVRFTRFTYICWGETPPALTLPRVP